MPVHAGEAGASGSGDSFRDNSGTITYDEFKNVFKATLAEDSIPFDFDGYASPH